MDLDRDVLAPAERAADAGQVQPHERRRQGQRRAHLVAVDVQPLRRHVQVDTAVLGREREAGLRAEERLVLHPDLVAAGHDHVGLEGLLAVADADVAQHVAGRPDP